MLCGCVGGTVSVGGSVSVGGTVSVVVVFVLVVLLVMVLVVLLKVLSLLVLLIVDCVNPLLFLAALLLIEGFLLLVKNHESVSSDLL